MSVDPSFNEATAEARLAIILARHNIGHTVPVPVDWIEEYVQVKYHSDLSPTTMGYACYTPDCHLIGINANHHRYTQRVTAVHEFAHIMNGDPGYSYTCQLGGWWHAKVEARAHWVASIILLPYQQLLEILFDGVDTAGELADFFAVDHGLLQWRFRADDIIRHICNRDRLRQMQRNLAKAPWAVVAFTVLAGLMPVA